MTTIRLVGPPAVERDGVALRPPRGRKAWAVLSYLVLADHPPSRRSLAAMLFSEADDPLGALRWTLAELRRALFQTLELGGDPVSLTLATDVILDVHLVTRECDDTSALLHLGAELLEGMDLSASPQFESWLLVERHRLSAMIEARLREATVSLLATGQAEEALRYAVQAVARNPLEEGNHALLVRSLAMTGDHAAALRQVAVCEDILRRELGLVTSPSLREAATARTSPLLRALGGRAAAASQLEAGRAAIGAGAVDAGLQCLRRAVTEAAICRDVALQARALAALGSALVHAARGRDEEGSIALHEALQLAAAAGDRATAVAAQRELGFVEVQAGRRQTAEDWLAKAQSLAETDEELAAILGARGMNASDGGDYPTALHDLSRSVELARRSADRRQEAWSLSILGRAHLLRGELSQAGAALHQSLRLVEDQRWLAFLPWPQTLQAELDLAAGDLEGADETLERAWALGCQLDDPCWEAMAARGLGLVSMRRGNREVAQDWLQEAAARSTRVSDRYQWVHAHVLDTMITAALEREDETGATPFVHRLATLAARCDMRELVVRAHLHRSRLGDPSALVTARSLGADIDNPALADLLADPAGTG